MSTPRIEHSVLGVGSIHSIVNWNFTDAAARASQALSAADIGKLSFTIAT